MKLMGNKINLKGITFAEYLKKAEDDKLAKIAAVETKQEVKTAEVKVQPVETKPEVKVAADKDEAESSGQLDVKANPQNCPELPKEEKSTSKPTAKKEGDEAETSGQPQAEAKLQNNPQKPDEKKASTPKFVKIAKLDPKTKAWLKDYWTNLYPAEYVDAMIQDQ
jgi:hypothetical protein